MYQDQNNTQDSIDNNKNISLAVDNTEAKKTINFKWIERFFKRMDHRYQILWRKSFMAIDSNVDEMKYIWFEDLKDVTQHAFDRAFKKIITDPQFKEYPPHLAAMDYLCRPLPKDFGILSDDDAFNLYLNPNTYKSNALVFRAGQKGQDTYRNHPLEKCRKKFLESYHALSEEVLSGDLDNLSIPAYLLDTRPIEERLGTSTATHKPEKEYSKLSVEENRNLIFQKLGMAKPSYH